MNEKTQPMARRAGLTRHLGLDHNPLRRRTDKIETCIMAGLLAAFLAGAPLAAAAAGSWVHTAGLRELRAQRSWHQVSAVLVQAAPRQVPFRHWLPEPWVRAWWAPSRGRARAVGVPVPPGARAGTLVHVWADRAGPVAGTPLTSDEITARAIAAAMAAVTFLAIVMAGLARAARWLLARQRLGAWDAEWASTGPRWTRHQ